MISKKTSKSLVHPLALGSTIGNWSVCGLAAVFTTVSLVTDNKKP